MRNTERQRWIDVFKSLGIFLIVLGHSLRFGVIRNFVYYFHVPAFFFIAGVVAKEKKFNKAFLLEQFKRLMIPYYLFGMISIAVYAILGGFAANSLDVHGVNDVSKNVVNLLYGRSELSFNAPLWFLPALFVTKVLFQVLCNALQRKRSIYLSIFAVLGSILAYVYTNARGVSLPFSLELVFKLFPFYVFGRICAPVLRNVADCSACTTKKWLFSVVLLSITFVATMIAPAVIYTNNKIPNPVIFYGIAMMGCMGLYYLSISLQQVKWLGYLGRNTLSVLVMHKFPIVFFQIINFFIIINP